MLTVFTIHGVLQTHILYYDVIYVNCALPTILYTEIVLSYYYIRICTKFLSKFLKWYLNFRSKYYITDINECSPNSPCGNNANCFNSAGSYNCQCKPGFYAAGNTNMQNGNSCQSNDTRTYVCFKWIIWLLILHQKTCKVLS